MLIGITGPQGSGKSSIADYLGKCLGIEVIHGDELSHEILDLNLYNECLSWFELNKEESVDRKKLGSLLFAPGNEELKKRYNELIYDLFLKRIKAILSDGYTRIIDWNFLPITSLFDMCDFNILVDCPLEIRLQRVMQRDNISREYAMRRESAGIKYHEVTYDLALNNYDAKLEDLAMEVKKLLWK